MNPTPDNVPQTFRGQGTERNDGDAFEPKTGSGSYPPQNQEPPKPDNAVPAPSEIPKIDKQPAPAPGSATFFDPSSDSKEGPTLNLDNKVTWRPSVTRERTATALRVAQSRSSVVRAPIAAKQKKVYDTREVVFKK